MYSAQLNITKYKIEALADASIRSCFSEYCISLLDNYDLLYVDTTYRVSDGGTGQLINHIAGYIEENLTTDFNSFYKISYTDAKAVSCIFADEDNYRSLKKQIRKYAHDNGMDLTNDEALNYYISEKLSCRDCIKDYSVNEFEIEYIITGAFGELFTESDDECISDDDSEYNDNLFEQLENTSYDVKLERLIDVIEINQRENYSECFDFSNLLESAEIIFYMNGGDKTYEITKTYSLR